MATQSNAIPFIIQGKNVVLVVDNKPHTITEEHLNYNLLLQALKQKDWDSVRALVSVSKAIEVYSASKFAVVNGVLTKDGEEVHSVIATRILDMFKNGFDINPLLNFVANLDANPSYRAKQESYQFIEKGNLPITEDGCFLAYKKVRDTYYDVHSNQVLNKPYDKLDATDLAKLPYKSKNGVTVDIVNKQTRVAMPRNEVNDNSEQTCSYGLHFCSIGYLKHFSGERIVILKINPKDIVSIPKDYNDTKGRCSEYLVVGEVDDVTKPENAFPNKTLDNRFDNVPPKPYRQNVRGQWIDARGSFLPKQFIPK